MSDRLVTAAEVRGPSARVLRLKGQSGTLRIEGDSLAFERTDGRRVFEKPREVVTVLRRHRCGHGFWVRVDRRKLFVVPLAKQRRRWPPTQPHNPLWYARLLLFLLGVGRARRANIPLVRHWLDELTGGRGLSVAAGGLSLRLRIVVWIGTAIAVLVAITILSH